MKIMFKQGGRRGGTAGGDGIPLRHVVCAEVSVRETEWHKCRHRPMSRCHVYVSYAVKRIYGISFILQS